MKALVLGSYGSSDHLDLTAVDTPVPAADEVLVRVRATSVNPYDWHHMRGEPRVARMMPGTLGLRAPKLRILGGDMAGQVEAVGEDVTEFRPGDDVFALLEQGGFAEYVSVPERLLARKPGNLSYEQAAAVPMAATTALLGLRDVARIEPGLGPRQRGLGRSGNIRRADRPGAWRESRRGVQLAERGSGQVDRRRRRHRLHQPGLHAERTTLRRAAGHRGKPPGLRLPAGTGTAGNAGPNRRAGRAMATARRAHVLGARDGTVGVATGSHGGHRLVHGEEADPHDAHHAHRGWKGHPGHQPEVPPSRHTGSRQIPGTGPRRGQGSRNYLSPGLPGCRDVAVGSD